MNQQRPSSNVDYFSADSRSSSSSKIRKFEEQRFPRSAEHQYQRSTSRPRHQQEERTHASDDRYHRRPELKDHHYSTRDEDRSHVFRRDSNDSKSYFRKHESKPIRYDCIFDIRRKSRSPSPLPASNILPLDQWPRKLRCWDICPPGFEGMSSAQVKNTGLFIPATYQPKVTNLTPFVDPARTTFLFQQSSGNTSASHTFQDQASLAMSLNPALAKQTRRLYVAGFPEPTTPRQLEEFFNDLMDSYGFSTSPGASIDEVIISTDRTYAFVDMKTSTETNSALAFDGITFEGHVLKVRRPKDYLPTTYSISESSFDISTIPDASLEAETASVPISNVVHDSPNKIFIGNIPYHFGEEEIIAILSSFGALKAFSLVRDSSGFSKGYAFCEYVNPEITNVVIQGLHMFEVGEKKLTVQKSMCNAPLTKQQESMDPASLFLNLTSGESIFGKQTHVLQLMNIVSAEDLADDNEYAGILEDIKKECSNFGLVEDIWVPRLDSSGAQLAGIGKAFVKFEKILQATNALQALAGRQFLDRIVLTAYYDEENFNQRIIQ